MSDEARIEAATKIIDDRLPDVSAGWSFAQQTDFARQMARDALAAADAAGDIVTVSTDDLRAVLEMLENMAHTIYDEWREYPNTVTDREALTDGGRGEDTEFIHAYDRLKASVEANT